ncbi:transcriptional regulator with XRE-family HTH domain [Nonomuraea thailandensis]|uniref:Transcriptional regulator with XRE-family HTH domain n=1 Tax=Nonomuraea thailandensis TaxID=1188745 RepID=A0A9X2GIF1_9ACTN|nr:helix-turn-helix transcriptional regulator [Nonomuraea thailandensis]MCP2358287.1 transcriptional regulator with XRE-family HTH domain [Nonomuraea thailandensis]
MDSERNNQLGRFLRERRALVRPEQAGMPAQGRRLVPGLRRDEVARLAGLSAGYYARLEQGRERPTRQTVEGLVRALRLDEQALVELYRLARPTAGRRRPGRVERVAPEVLALLNDWTVAPAFVLGWSGDVLARNPLANVLHNRFVLGDNLLRMIFLDPGGRQFFRDWTTTARAAVQDLRRAARQSPDEHHLRELVGELAITSHDFRRLWAAPEPRGALTPGSRFHHPDVGDLHLRTEAFPIAGTPGLRLIAHPAEPDSPSAQALALLGTLAT